MKFIRKEYFIKEYIKNKAIRVARISCAGPGKFAVFILLCIIVIATFESLGLSNRERNIEFRNLSNMVIALNSKDNTQFSYTDLNQSDKIKNLDSLELNQRLRVITQKDFEDKNIERSKMLLNAAVDQYIYEKDKSENLRSLSKEEKIKRIFDHIMKENRYDETEKEENEKEEDFYFDI